MNRRMKMKKLKREVKQLRSENEFLNRILNRPSSVPPATRPNIIKLRTERAFDRIDCTMLDDDYVKDILILELLDGVKPYVNVTKIDGIDIYDAVHYMATLTIVEPRRTNNSI